MQTLTFADHFASLGMTMGSVMFLILEILSIVLSIIIVVHYRRVVSKHRMLPNTIQHTLAKQKEIGTSFLLWAYIIMTIAITLGTVTLFYLQPHLY